MIGLLFLAIAADPRAGTVLKREVVAEFAACVRRRAPDRAAALLATEPEGAAEKRAMRTIAGAYDACISGRQFLSFPVELFRGQLAELLFRDDAILRDRAAALPAGAVLLPDTAKIEKASAALPAEHRDTFYAGLFRIRFARCVVSANPQAVASLIPTDPASAQERTALMKAGDTLMRCMPQGVTYRIQAAELRPYLMSALYYRTVTSATQGA